MRKIYRNYLYISKNARISERVFVTRTVIAAVLVAVSTILFCSVTMAYFTDSVTSGGNKLVGGNYDIIIELETGNATRHTTASHLLTENGNTTTYTAKLSLDDTYSFKLIPQGNATKGFCYINVIQTLENGKKIENHYYTEQIPPTGDNAPEGGCYTVNLTAAAKTVISFLPIWGEQVEDSWNKIELSALPEMTSITTTPDENTLEIYHSETPHIEIPIPKDIEKDILPTIEEVAAYYKIPAEDICIYNGISAFDETTEAIKVPWIDPQTNELPDYQLPVTDAPLEVILFITEDDETEEPEVPTTFGLPSANAPMLFSARPTMNAGSAMLFSAKPENITEEPVIIYNPRLEAIAAEYGITPELLCTYNAIAPETPLKRGMQLRVPKKEFIHTAATGETLQAIAMIYGVPLEALMKYNGFTAEYTPIDGDLISVPNLNIIPIEEIIPPTIPELPENAENPGTDGESTAELPKQEENTAPAEIPTIKVTTSSVTGLSVLGAGEYPIGSNVMLFFTPNVGCGMPKFIDVIVNGKMYSAYDNGVTNSEHITYNPAIGQLDLRAPLFGTENCTVELIAFGKQSAVSGVQNPETNIQQTNPETTTAPETKAPETTIPQTSQVVPQLPTYNPLPEWFFPESATKETTKIPETTTAPESETTAETTTADTTEVPETEVTTTDEPEKPEETTTSKPEPEVPETTESTKESETTAGTTVPETEAVTTEVTTIPEPAEITTTETTQPPQTTPETTAPAVTEPTQEREPVDRDTETPLVKPEENQSDPPESLPSQINQ